MILNIITGVVTVSNIISVTAALLDPETMASLQQNRPDTVGMTVPSVIEK